MTPPVASALRDVPFFNGMKDGDLSALARLGRTESAPARRVVFREGERANELYIVLEGSVEITRGGVRLAEAGRGTYLGELALIDAGVRSATAATREACTFFVLERGPFLELLSRSPQMLSHLFTDLSAKIRESNEKFFREVLVRKEAEIERHRGISEMVAGVAHEINTPIGIAHTAASLLTERLEGGTPDGSAWGDAQEAARLIQKNVARAARLVQSFKSLAANQATDPRIDVDLPDLINEAAELSGLDARRAGIRVTVEHRLPAAARRWTGYPGSLTQILLNLLQNAERHGFPNGGPGSIEIALSRNEETFTLSVRDDGRGIDPSDLPRVFDPFYTTGRERGCTGLGLSIVRSIVTSILGGVVEIESAPGKGTCVRVAFPCSVPEKEKSP